MRRLPPFTGVVLAGGDGRRFGGPKALAPHPDDGRPLVSHVAEALVVAGAGEVLVVGGDAAVAALGLATVADDHPGEGPLGALGTALRTAAFEEVVVLPCDLPAVDGDTVRELVATLRSHPEADVVLARVEDRLQLLAGAWRRRASAVVDTAFAAGRRALRDILDDLWVVEVVGLDPDALRDVDTPEDLDRYALGGDDGGPAR